MTRHTHLSKNQEKDLLQAALAHFPQELLQKAYEAKRADRDTVVHRVAQTASEIEALERHRQFLTAFQLHQEGQLAEEESMLGLVKAVLSPRSLQEVEDDSGFYRAIFAEELVHSVTAETQLEHIGGVNLNPAISAPLPT